LVSERACERIAEHQGRSLPVRFWNEPTWSRAYHAQVIAANGLLKVFDEEAVLGAFESNPSVRSVGASFFARQVASRQASLEAERDMATETPTVEVRDPTRGPRGGRHAGDTIRARLRRIDASSKDEG
jgi:hypothetical protein